MILELMLIQLDPQRAPTLEALPDFLDELNAGSTDIALMPEIWNSSFRMDDLATRHIPAETELDPLLSWSRAHPDCLLCPGSLALKTGSGRYVNRSWLIKEGLIWARYDKMHLFRPMGEADLFQQGSQSSVVSIPMHGQEIRVGMMICYDLRFPELARDLAAKGAEILLVPAQWPANRLDAFQHLLKSRAMENGIAVAGANRLGQTGRLHFPGGGAVYAGPAGRELVRDCDQSACLKLSLDLDLARAERQELDALRDMRYRLLPPE
jgi:omega-amidase